MRLLITVIALIAYCVSLSLYFWYMNTAVFPPHCMKLWYNYTTVAMVVFYVLDTQYGNEDFLHKQFKFICILSVIFNYALIILTHHCFLLDPLSKFILFNGAILLSCVLVLISALRNNYFNKSYI